jgi:hypothetical protein
MLNSLIGEKKVACKNKIIARLKRQKIFLVSCFLYEIRTVFQYERNGTLIKNKIKVIYEEGLPNI